MKRLNRLVAVLFVSVAAVILASAIAMAQPASQSEAGSPPMGTSGDQRSMMGGGMGMAGMGEGVWAEWG